jgi:hypothetical protein
MSLVAENGEWKTRKINLLQVVRSFISQLKPGQDLTKISLPAEICYPYSMLEVFAYRELSPITSLYGISKETEPLQRFLIVLKFLLSTIREETFEKKPFNSVLGETHIAWVEDEQGDRTDFIGEQVSHHPPISAFIVRNNKHKFEITGNISFGVRFGGNSVSVTTSGRVSLSFSLFLSLSLSLSFSLFLSLSLSLSFSFWIVLLNSFTLTVRCCIHHTQ